MSEAAELKKTPLYDFYKQRNIKLVDFNGWALPVSYTGIIEEHEAVRTKAGLFDVSHMGEISVIGSDAAPFLNSLMTNNIAGIVVDQSQYNVLCYPHGGTIDDLIVSKLGEENFLVTCNASNVEKVYDWMQEKAQEQYRKQLILENQSLAFGLIALQGPNAEKILQKITLTDLSNLAFFHLVQKATVDGIPDIMISRTGYTGEDGFELYVAADRTEELWDSLLKTGSEFALKPCGLGARDTLRLEAALSLYGHELSESISPLEAGIGFAVKTKKDSDFIGKKALIGQKEKGLEKRIKGFELIGKGIAREGYKVLSESGSEIGYVTSGTKSPTIGKSIGLALVSPADLAVGTRIRIEIRSKTVDAQVIDTPFYKRGQ